MRIDKLIDEPTSFEEEGEEGSLNVEIVLDIKGVT